MYIVSVTGGLAAGKSEACDYFGRRGAVVIDLDEVARRLLSAGGPVVPQIVEAFGEDVLAEDGSVDRSRLAAKAFASYENAQLLNSIVHPAVASDVMPGLTEMGLLQNPPPLVVLCVPMLVEAPVFGEIADVVLALSAPEEVRVRRAVARGMAEDDARARIGCQATDAQRESAADWVIVNDGTREALAQHLERFWDEVVEGAA